MASVRPDCKKGEVWQAKVHTEATLYPGVEVASDGEADATPIQVFVQWYVKMILILHFVKKIIK